MVNFEKICIIGMGLVGGSMALALKKSGYKGELVGYDISKGALNYARRIKAIDSVYESPREAVKGADLVILAVPVGYYKEIFKEVADVLSKDVTITDVGSVKDYVEKTVKAYLPQGIQFIGGHPMAGSEKVGMKAASPFLYENAYYFLTVNNHTDKNALERLKTLIRALGAYPVEVDVEEHDKIVAQISHIPHVIAVILANILDRKERGISYIPFVGGGFRDTTRIATGNPEMWKDILFLNKNEILEGLTDIEDMIREFKRILGEENEEKVLENLQKAKIIRESIPHTSRDYIPSIYEIFIDAEDRPGTLGKLTQLMGKNDINIKEIEIRHVREGGKGAIRIGLESHIQQEKALNLLRLHNFSAEYGKGGNGKDVHNQ